jgi:hypothetical protein
LRAWGRRSVFVACPGRSGWQAMENDGLPHKCNNAIDPLIS